ncbi:regulator of Vps4 activity in the MVB pathway-domain-containing protein [Cytidiella melzeri]|nr:regulator of Vps4 activity in the MVB pathway-domain-containing protein [Cytidiella melzeri]
MTTSWDSTRIKAQLRLTAQRLGQLQDKIDSQGQITRRDIAYLLQQRNVAIARAKVQKLIRDDVYEDLLQTLEMLVGVLLEHAGELERSGTTSPIVLEAASSIIYAAPHTESRDLQIVKDILTQRLGPDFARAATANQDNYVSSRVLRDLSARPPSAAQLDHYLYSIAKAHAVHWMPDFQPHEKVDQISAMLDPASIPAVDMARLRLMCSHGLPEYPPWLRPRVWRLLLGTLPADKTLWKDEARKQRDNYYDLVRRLLEPIDSLPSPSTPLSRSDNSIVEISKELTHVPRGLFVKLEEEPEAVESCPLEPAASDDIRIPCAFALDTRLRLIREHESQESELLLKEGVPEIRLESTPEIRLEGPVDVPGSPTSTHSAISTTLLASRAYNSFGAHPKHASALLRLLYVHSSLNPAHRSPQIASLLVPLYSALADEADPEDTAHLEADAFWLFEAMIGEFSELEDSDGGEVWMRRLAQRASWADTELVEDLQAKGLDPALPHYSYRWLTTLLTHTLPLPAILTIWDAIFSRPARVKGVNPKIDYLLDICASMLVCARGPLFSLGRPSRKPLNLWGDGTTSMQTKPLSDRDLEEAFASGMIFLQNYPLKEIGGADRILQLAYDLAAKREAETQNASSYVMPSAAALGARLRNTVWRSTPASKPIPEAQEDTDEEESDESDEDDDDDDKPIVPPSQRSTLSSRLATSVWKGITNQSAVEPSHPPTASPGPTQETLPESQTEEVPAAQRASALWNYATKMRDSDTAATLAKVSTNWRVKALDAWSKRNSASTTSPPPSGNPDTLSPTWVPQSVNRTSLEASNITDRRRSSLPNAVRHDDGYTPPARPAFFRPVRDSFVGDMRPDLISPTGSDYSAFSENDIERYKQHARSNTLAALNRNPSPSSVRMGGPRPLLLGSAPVPVLHSRSSTLPQNVLDKQFADAVRAKRPSTTGRGSQSSVSSLSPQDQPTALSRAHTPEATGTSRLVPLNRTVSPMAVARARRQESVSSAASSPVATQRQLPMEAAVEEEPVFAEPNWQTANARDSVTTVDSLSSPPPQPWTQDLSSSGPWVVPAEAQRGSLVIGEFGEVADSIAPDATPRKKGTRALSIQLDDSSDSSAAVPQRTSRVRSKRYPSRLATLRSKYEAKASPVDRAPSPNTLTAPEWNEEVEATTPKAASFDDQAHSPISRRPRKLSGDNKGRKVSSERPERTKHKRESAAAEGDDEGYDELLSAYESEDMQ